MITRVRNTIGLFCLLALASGQAFGADDCSAVADRLNKDLESNEDLKALADRYNEKFKELGEEQTEIKEKFVDARCLVQLELYTNPKCQDYKQEYADVIAKLKRNYADQQAAVTRLRALSDRIQEAFRAIETGDCGQVGADGSSCWALKKAGFAIPGHVLATIGADTVDECAKKCFDADKCLSFDYSTKLKTCSLNRAEGVSLAKAARFYNYYELTCR